MLNNGIFFHVYIWKSALIFILKFQLFWKVCHRCFPLLTKVTIFCYFCQFQNCFFWGGATFVLSVSCIHMLFENALLCAYISNGILCSGYDTKLRSIVRLQFWCSDEGCVNPSLTLVSGPLYAGVIMSLRGSSKGPQLYQSLRYYLFLPTRFLPSSYCMIFI